MEITGQTQDWQFGGKTGCYGNSLEQLVLLLLRWYLMPTYVMVGRTKQGKNQLL